MTSALLIVPPFLKHATGPLLGPSMLAGAAARAGHDVEVIDLNARWIAGGPFGDTPWTPPPFVGDHDRDEGFLRLVQEDFRVRTLQHVSGGGGRAVSLEAILALRAGHEPVACAARHVAANERAWIDAQLGSAARPDLFCVSVMYAGQVLWALAVTLAARERWPGVPVVWGGAHVTALAEEIARDARYGIAADAFVAGYAEGTFVDLLDAIAAREPWPSACIRAGDRHWERARPDNGSVVPTFHDVRLPRGARLTLPTQLSRGCAYGRCAFCTYPATEGPYRDLAVTSAQGVIDEAIRRGAYVSFKDSLLTPPLLRQAGHLVDGRTAWSGCTKLSPALDAAMLKELASQGCRTLEIGLETLLDDAQVLVDKRQSRVLFLRTLEAADVADVSLVINYMTGFPGVDRVEEERCLGAVTQAVAARPSLVAKIEHNRFELERGAPLAKSLPGGVEVTQRWPWSSVLEWSYTAPRATHRLAVVA